MKGQSEKVVREILGKITDAERTNYDRINLELSKKRLGWYDKNRDYAESLEGTDVRKAYTLLMTYLGINPEQAPVVYEDERKIVWRSYNWCPVLEACKHGGFDTRTVCRKGWEQSVQALIEKINPKLRFSRNYEKLRPYAEYCEEFIELIE
ncbi:MAG: hypothetical protein QMD14_05925 [Candidatus Aenigmarchaeota archaeon]|nr:hypothetical protein [Candidatus Aenigmarchaeota archaeon]